MEVFVDTSGVLAVINAADDGHARAAKGWRRLLVSGERLLTTNYVLLETFAIAQHRLGFDAVRLVDRDIAPLMEIVWIDAELHRRAMAAVLAASKRHLSLVDCASFEVMRSRGLTNVFTLDRDFARQGFTTIP